MRIAIASGKGGTGKSTLAVNLAYSLSEKIDGVCLLDCDVEEPNCALFVRPNFEVSEDVRQFVPKIDFDKCAKCGKCARVCQFNAIASVRGRPVVFDELCHSCESCMISCPSGAISAGFRLAGSLSFSAEKSPAFVEGRMKIGETVTPPIIKAVKNFAASKNFAVEIIDCPPGTSCPMITAVGGADFTLLVTEPTPFGLHDLSLAADVLRALGLPFEIVINKSSENDVIIEEYARARKIEIAARIPDDIEIARAYSEGVPAREKFADFAARIDALAGKIMERGRL